MPITITVSHYQFTISTPYLPGHICTETEAQLLNKYRISNLTKLIERRVQKYQKLYPQEEVFSFEHLEELQQEVEQDVNNYQFSFDPLKDKISTLERERLAIAKEIAIQTIPDGVPEFEQKRNLFIQQTLASSFPELEKEARRRLTLRLQTTSPSDLGL